MTSIVIRRQPIISKKQSFLWYDLSLLHLSTPPSSDSRPAVPAAAVEGVPQLRCVGSGRRALTAWVSLLARCDLTAVRLAGPSRQVGC